MVETSQWASGCFMVRGWSMAVLWGCIEDHGSPRILNATGALGSVGNHYHRAFFIILGRCRRIVRELATSSLLVQFAKIRLPLSPL